MAAIHVCSVQCIIQHIVTTIIGKQIFSIKVIYGMPTYYIFCHAYLEVLLLRNVFRYTLGLQPCDPRKSPSSLVVVVFISSYKDLEEHFHLVERTELK